MTKAHAFLNKIKHNSLINADEAAERLLSLGNANDLFHLRSASDFSNKSECIEYLLHQLPSHRRKDAVVLLEFRLSASKDWFNQVDKTVQRQYFETCYSWVDTAFFSTPLLAALEHSSSEYESPVLAVLTIPLKPNGELSARWYSQKNCTWTNKAGTFSETVAQFGLERRSKGSIQPASMLEVPNGKTQRSVEVTEQKLKRIQLKQKRNKQNLNAAQLTLNRLEHADKIRKRKEDAHRKIQLGGLIIKAGLDSLPIDQLLGALIDIADKCQDSSEIKRWKSMGSAAFSDGRKKCHPKN